jgi:hypothetical protein
VVASDLDRWVRYAISLSFAELRQNCLRHVLLAAPFLNVPYKNSLHSIIYIKFENGAKICLHQKPQCIFELVFVNVPYKLRIMQKVIFDAPILFELLFKLCTVPASYRQKA